MPALVDMGKISSRGQVAIPAEIRDKLSLHEGSKVLFYAQDDTLLVKKVTTETFSELTKPIRKLKKKISEAEVNETIHTLRKQ